MSFTLTNSSDRRELIQTLIILDGNVITARLTNFISRDDKLKCVVMSSKLHYFDEYFISNIRHYSNLR